MLEDIEFNLQDEENLVQELEKIEILLLEQYKNQGKDIYQKNKEYFEDKIHNDVMNLYIDGYFARAILNEEKITLSSIWQYIKQDREENRLRRKELGIRNTSGPIANYSLDENRTEEDDCVIENMIEGDTRPEFLGEEKFKHTEIPNTAWDEDPERIALLKENFNEQVLYQQACKVFPRVMEKILALPETQLHRFCAIYLLTENYLDCMVDQSYTELKHNWRDEPIIPSKCRLSAYHKRIYLSERYMPFNFWQDYFYKDMLDKKTDLSYRSWKDMCEKYNKYQQSFTKNMYRDWEGEIAKLLKEFENEDKQLLDMLRFELSFCKGHKTLRRPKHICTEHDRVLAIGKNTECCTEYREIAPLYVRWKIFQDVQYEEHPLWAKYKEHRAHCMQKCQRYEVYLGQKMIRRHSRMLEDLLTTKQFFYPDHQSKKNNLQKGDTSAVIKKYYEKVYAKKPSDLYKAYLEILSDREGKSFKPTAKSQKEHKNRGSKLGYSLETRCMCGAVNHYKLNALRFPLVTVGRQQEDGVWVAHINLCADEERKLSRHQFYFKYNTAKGDWMFGIGSGNTQKPEDPEKLKALALRVLYMPPQDLFNKLDDIKTAGGDKIACEKALKYCWKQLGAKEQIPLSEIALIRVVSSSGFKFQGEKSKGVYHPIFGLLENTAWLIEINANRADQSIIASAIEKSVLAD